jgi:RNase P subunit RPR2
MVRARPVTQGFKFQVRIADLGPADFVLMTCRACGVSRRVAPWMLYSIAPATLTIKSLEPRMLCRSCGKRGYIDWSVYRVEPPMHEVRGGE